MKIKNTIKEWWKNFNRPLTEEELKRMRGWDAAQNGISKCPCCDSRHTKHSNGYTGPK